MHGDRTAIAARRLQVASEIGEELRVGLDHYEPPPRPEAGGDHGASHSQAATCLDDIQVGAQVAAQEPDLAALVQMEEDAGFGLWRHAPRTGADPGEVRHSSQDPPGAALKP